QGRESLYILKVHRRESARVDRLQVPAAALYVEHLLLVAEQVRLAQLDRRIAAAMQHQRLVAPEQARGVHAWTERAGEASCFGVVPEALHRRKLYFRRCFASS